jgi:anaerobic ribonucleoside-triphosphate reductase
MEGETCTTHHQGAVVTTAILKQAPQSPANSQRTRCEVWTRVMGYHRPVSSFNTGKQGEFNERRFFNEKPTA